MEPEGSLPCSEEPSIDLYPEPDRSNSYHPIITLLRVILILYTHLRLSLSSGLFRSIPNIVYAFLFYVIRAICRAHLILLDLIILIIPTWR
jgi:hypothetical protein